MGSARDQHGRRGCAGHQTISRMMPQTYRILRDNAPLAHMAAGQGFSSLADWLLAVVLTVLTYDITHSSTAVSLLVLTRLAPYAVVLPWSGPLLDRIDRRLLMAGLGIGRVVCMLGLLLVRSPETLPLLFPLVFASSSLSCLLRPTLNATIPSLVGETDAVAANGLIGQVEAAAHILGPAIAAGFIVTHSLSLAVLVTAAAFALSAVSFMTARMPARHAGSAHHDETTSREALAGFRYILHENQGVLVALAIAAAGLSLVLGAYSVLGVVLCVKTFHFGGQGVGWLEALYGLGGLAGGALVGSVTRRRRIVHVFAGGAAGNALGALLLAVSPHGPLPFLCIAAVGCAGVVIQVTGTTILQAAAPRDMLGRTFAAFEGVLVVGMVAGGATAGPLLKVLDPRVATALYAVAAGLLLLVALPGLRSLESILGVRVFLRGVPMLAGLSRQLIDELAPRFESVTVPRDVLIVREGEPGDLLYIISEGEVEVSVGGKTVRRLGAGSYFGELALLHDVPRTASIRARRPTSLYCLKRDDFQDLVRHAGHIPPALVKEARARYVYAPVLSRW